MTSSETPRLIRLPFILRRYRCGECHHPYWSMDGAMRCWWRHECQRVYEDKEAL